ncbi:hypothetical protein Tco_1580423 [Tanacetum coccineum]
MIKQRMQAAQDRQKSYADWKRKPMEFEVGDRVMLKVSPWKGVVRFGKRGKLNPSYVGPFKVLAKVGKAAYKLELPQEFSRVHHTFHVSNMKKCYADEPLVMPLEEIHVDDKLQFVINVIPALSFLKLQTVEDLQGDALLHYDVEMELMNLILLYILNDIYNFVDACTSAKDMWKRVERLIRGTIQNKVDRETRFTNEFD